MVKGGEEGKGIRNLGIKWVEREREKRKEQGIRDNTGRPMRKRGGRCRGG